MTLPVYIAAGTPSFSTAAPSPGVPAGYQDDDLFICVVESANELVSTPSGWTQVPASPQSTGSAGVDGGTRLTIFYKVVSGAQSAPTITDSGAHTFARIVNIRGVNPASPIHISAGGIQATVSAPLTCPAVTTTIDDCLILNCVGSDASTGAAQFSGWTNSNLSGLTERVDNASTAGTGGAVAIATGGFAMAGSTGTTAVTQATAAAATMITIALSPLPPALSIVGNVPLTLTPAATLNVQHTLIGSVPLTLTPAATLNVRDGALSVIGNVPLTLTPAATFNLRDTFSIVGDVPLALTPAATLLKYHQSSIVSAVQVILTPNALTEFHTPRITAELGFITSSVSSLWAWNFSAAFPLPTLSAIMYPEALDIAVSFPVTSLSALTGASISGGFLDTSLSSTGTLVETMSVEAEFISTTLSASVNVDARITAGLGFISSTLTALGGANIAFSGPTFTLSAQATTEDHWPGASLSFLETSLSASGIMEGRINVSGGFIETNLSYFNINVSGPVFTLSASASEDLSNSIAYVLNVHTTESWKYTNYPFMHIIHIAGKPYGVKADGLYLLEGATDSGTAINGTVTSKDTDFGIFASKNVHEAYLNSDTATTIQPTVDGVLAPSAYPSSFGGRKVDIARGLEGRYWKFKIDNIIKLEGLEITPVLRQRRVK